MAHTASLSLLLIICLSLPPRPALPVPNSSYTSIIASPPEESEEGRLGVLPTNNAVFNTSSSSNTTAISSIATQSSTCNNFWFGQGEWVWEAETPPRYSFRCPFIRDKYNCIKNNRPQNDYINYAWRPAGLNGLPRFDAGRWLRLMTNKVVAFMGDSINREFCESLFCQIHAAHEVEVWNGFLGTRQWHGLRVRETNTTILWRFHMFLVRNSNHAVDFEVFKAEELQGGAHHDPAHYMLWLDEPDPAWFDSIGFVDHLVLETGQFIHCAKALLKNASLFQTVNSTNHKAVAAAAYEQVLTAVRERLERAPDFKGQTYYLSIIPSNFDVNNAMCPAQSPYSTPDIPEMDLKVHKLLYDAERRALCNATRMHVIAAASMSSRRADARVQLWRFFRKESEVGTYSNVTRTGMRKGNPWDCLHFCLPGLPDIWTDMLQHMMLMTQALQP